MMTSPIVRNVSTWFTLVELHNDDVTMGGHTSPPFEADLQPNDQMNATIAWLTANPSSVTPAFGETVNGVNISYGYVYQDTVNIIRNHKMQCKYK
jgi:hypothetical protein